MSGKSRASRFPAGGLQGISDAFAGNTPYLRRGNRVNRTYVRVVECESVLAVLSVLGGRIEVAGEFLLGAYDGR
jgi:hypothetical protein